MKISQLLIVALLIVSMLHSLYKDFNGTKEREPYGFYGAVITLILTALLAWCYWCAGAFSTLVA